MSVSKKATVFLILTFVLSWSPIIFASIGDHRDISSAPFSFFIALFGPVVAAVICSLAFEKGHRLKALGLRLRISVWLILAPVIAAALAVMNIAITASLSTHELAGLDGMARQFADLRHQDYSDPRSYLLVMASYTGLTFLGNSVLYTFTEEVGWRGYLYHLWRPFGFWRSSIATGLVWGIWHWPMIYLFGLNYPDHRALGLAIFPISTILFAVILTLVRDGGGSVLAPGILHAGVNSLALIVLVALDHPTYPWDAVGIGYLAALAAGALVTAAFQQSKPQSFIRQRCWTTQPR